MRLILGNITSKLVFSGKERQLELEVRRYFRYRPDNYNRSIMYRRKLWDGWTKLITEDGRIASGYVDAVIKKLQEEGYEDVVIEDRRNNMPVFKSGKMNYQIGRYTLYDHQKRLLFALRKNTYTVNGQTFNWRRGIWDAATNSGKTLSFMALLNNIENTKAILLVDNTLVFNDHLKSLTEVFGADNVGIISGKTYQLGKIVTLAMVKSLNNHIQTKNPAIIHDMANYFNVKGYDECHLAGSNTAAHVVSYIDAGVVIYMSGTPFLGASMDNKVKIVGMSGGILAKVGKKELMSLGVSLTPKITILLCKQITGHVDFVRQYEEGIFRSSKRNKMISEAIAARPDKQILVVFSKINHGKAMIEEFIREYPEYMAVTDWAHGSDKQRVQKVEDFKNKKLRILFASTILQVGVNVPCIETIIYTMSEKSPVALSQFLGRGERLNGDETTFEWIDFYDDCGEYAARHSKKRIKYYRSEGFEIKFDYPAKINGVPK